MSTHPPSLQEGQRVEFAAELDRSPDYTVPAGATGVVTYLDDSLLTIQMDEPVPGLEPWDNGVDFPAAEFRQATRLLRVHADR
ncbi:MAG TPA: hypothetical protein VEA38_07380, partial [Terriglobales bacterium]|nr:hypothetical protein [Terriglobales bacterium]